MKPVHLHSKRASQVSDSASSTPPEKRSQTGRHRAVLSLVSKESATVRPSSRIPRLSVSAVRQKAPTGLPNKQANVAAAANVTHSDVAVTTRTSIVKPKGATFVPRRSQQPEPLLPNTSGLPPSTSIHRGTVSAARKFPLGRALHRVSTPTIGRFDDGILAKPKQSHIKRSSLQKRSEEQHLAPSPSASRFTTRRISSFDSDTGLLSKKLSSLNLQTQISEPSNGCFSALVTEKDPVSSSALSQHSGSRDKDSEAFDSGLQNTFSGTCLNEKTFSNAFTSVNSSRTASLGQLAGGTKDDSRPPSEMFSPVPHGSPRADATVFRAHTIQQLNATFQRPSASSKTSLSTESPNLSSEKSFLLTQKNTNPALSEPSLPKTRTTRPFPTPKAAPKVTTARTTHPHGTITPLTKTARAANREAKTPLISSPQLTARGPKRLGRTKPLHLRVKTSRHASPQLKKELPKPALLSTENTEKENQHLPSWLTEKHPLPVVSTSQDFDSLSGFVTRRAINFPLSFTPVATPPLCTSSSFNRFGSQQHNSGLAISTPALPLQNGRFFRYIDVPSSNHSPPCPSVPIQACQLKPYLPSLQLTLSRCPVSLPVVLCDTKALLVATKAHDVQLSVIVSPSAVLSDQAIIKGAYPISIGPRTMVHPGVYIDASSGPISIGEDNIIEECVEIINR